MKNNENKSEPLVLDFEDGSDIKDELEGAAEKDAQKVAKDLNKAAKTTEKELNEPKTPTVKFKNGEGDNYKEGNAKGVKLLPEGMKLTLTEAPIPPDMADAYHNDKIVWPRTRGLSKDDYIKRRPNIDYENSEYNEVTPAEAKKIAKTAPETLRLMFDFPAGRNYDYSLGRYLEPSKHPTRRFITLNPNGRPANDRYLELPHEKAYYKKSGEEVTKTTLIPLDHLLNVADKIYVANEVYKDPDLLSARAEIPGGQNFANKGKQKSVLKIKNPDSWRGYDEVSPFGSYRGSNYGNFEPLNKKQTDYYYRNWKDEEKRARKKEIELRDLLAQGFDDTDRRVMTLKTDIDNHRKRANSYMKSYLDDGAGDLADNKAFTRNALSNKELYTPLAAFKALRTSMAKLKANLNDAENNITNIQNQGSAKSLSVKNNVNHTKDQIRKYMIELAKLEMQLDNISKEDDEALAAAQQKVDGITKEVNNAQASIDIIKNTGKYVPVEESYKPWGNAKVLYDRIIKEGLEEDFNDILESLYPQGLTESKKNDLLAYKDEMVKDMLDMED